MAECTTHHHACDCREAEFAALKAELEKRCEENLELHRENEKLREALELIAAPKRLDGTYNRCREACEELAREALKK